MKVSIIAVKNETVTTEQIDNVVSKEEQIDVSNEEQIAFYPTYEQLPKAQSMLDYNFLGKS